MVTKVSSGFVLWKSLQQCKIGQLFRDTANRLVRESGEVINIRSRRTYLKPSGFLCSRSSKEPFLNGPVACVMNNSMTCKVTECYSSNLSDRKINSQAQLMMNTLPAHPHDDRNGGHEQRRIVAMDIEELVKFLQDENASDICVIRVPPHLDYVNYFVICSGFGARHLRRMADGLVAEMKSVRVGRSNRRIRVEGEHCEDWMAVEMGTIVVHFMTEEARSKYELEKLWTLGPLYDDQYRNMEHILENNP